MYITITEQNKYTNNLQNESVIFTGDSQQCSNKKFYSFVKHNKTEQCGVAPLKHQGLTYTDPVDKANILNRQFESVFSKPQPRSLKQLAKQAIAIMYAPKMQMIDISIEGVDKRLQGLSPNSTDAKQFNCAFCDTSMTFCTHLV